MAGKTQSNKLNDEASHAARETEVLRRMLNTSPKPHAMKKPKRTARKAPAAKARQE